MPVFNNLKKIKGIYHNNKKIKTVHYNNLLVYQDEYTEDDDDIIIDVDTTYNYFVFDTSKVADTTTVTLQDYRAGDTTEYDGLTDWGDGIIDSELTHTYDTDGIYIVKTKYMINDRIFNSDTQSFGDLNTKIMLVTCYNINKNITNFKCLFEGCSSLMSLNLSNFNTENVTNMNSMFYGCSSLKKLNMTGWDTSNVTDMGGMFYGCSKLPLINVSHFNVSKVTKMNYMFVSCKVNGSHFKNWDISNATNLGGMFMDSIIINSLDLSSWDVSNVIDMTGMFCRCESEDYINVSNWDISDDAYTTQMFSGVDIENVIHNGVSDEDWQKMILVM